MILQKTLLAFDNTITKGLDANQGIAYLKRRSWGLNENRVKELFLLNSHHVK